MDISKDYSRYSRADLLALRYEGSARLRPHCANRTELHKLHFWKINDLSSNSSNSNNYGMKSGLSPERDSSSLASVKKKISARRALRNQERAHNHYLRYSSTGDPICEDDQTMGNSSISSSGNMNTSYKSASIDHRSISSSHLMPAFAKRRFGVAQAGGGGSVELNETQTEKASALNNYDDSPKEKPSIPSLGPANDINNSIGSSPIRRSAISTEWERGEKLSTSQDSDHSAMSPTFSIGRLGGGGLNVQERRIGSGRLLPRSDNWEYKNKDSESSQLSFDKDRPNNSGMGSQHRQGAKQIERSNDGLVERDRRPNERKLVDNRDRDRDRDRDRERDREDSKKMFMSGRRTTNKDKFNYGDCSIQSRGKRLNNYQGHDKHEPEWFSAGPTSQHETIDLHGFDEFESEPQNVELKSAKEDEEKELDSKPSHPTEKPKSRSSSISSVSNILDSNINKKDSDDLTTRNVTNKRNVDMFSKPELNTAFNFDAFLNMDPMEHSLMGNNSDVQGDVKSTSRFSQWFASKEQTGYNEHPNISESVSHEAQDIPSVKDLEAQMRKVDMRSSDYDLTTNQLMQAGKNAKSATRDTEAFKKLLQQLGAQNNSQPSSESFPTMINAPVGVRIAPRPNALIAQNVLNAPNERQQQPQMILCQEAQLKEEEYHQRLKKPELLSHRHFEIIAQNPLHLTMPSVAHETNNISGILPMQAQKRMAIQQLLQGIARGDVSVEVLEKELNNSNTTAMFRDIFATVLFEWRNNAHQNVSYANEMSQQNSAKMPVFNKNVVNEESYPQNTPNQGLNQHLRHTSSPTPLAFTPTSVLRKMTADKDTQGGPAQSGNQQQNFHQFQQQPHSKQHLHMLNESAPLNQLQPRMILGGNYALQQHHHQHQQQQLSVNSPQISPNLHPQMSQTRNQPGKWNPPAVHSIKSFGRPILKGTLNSNSGAQQPIHPTQFTIHNEIQQQIHQQQLKSIQSTDSVNKESLLIGPPPSTFTDGITSMQHSHYLHQQQRSQLRHRLLHGEMNRPSNPTTVCSENSDTENLMKTNNNHGGGQPISYCRGDRLSPTTNQLAQWFSPELLARASAGKLPLLNVNQALSLEEFERSMQHSSATVLN